jgi:GH18 family chitinase
MKKTMTFLLSLMFGFMMILSQTVLATHTSAEGLNNCIKATSLTAPTGSWYWSVDVQISNNCNHDVDLQGARYSVETPFKPTEARFSFDTSGMSWAQTNVINQVKGSSLPGTPSLNNYTSTLSLAYGDDSWIKTRIKPGGSLKLTLAASLQSSMSFTDDMSRIMIASFKVISNQEPPSEPITGSINIHLGSKPETGANFPAQASVIITGPNQFKQTVNLAWGGQRQLSDLVLGTYTIQSVAIEYGDNLYQAQIPGTLKITESSLDKTLDVTYQKQVINTGTIKLNLGQTPSQGLANPTITINDLTANSQQKLTLAWGSMHTIANASASHQYQIEAQAIEGFSRTAQPASFTLDGGKTVGVAIQYMVITPPPANGTINLSINGLPAGQSVNVMFTNNDTQQQTNKSVTNGTHSVTLAQGLYTVTANSYQQYHATMVTGTNPVSVGAVQSISIGFNYTNQPSQKRIVSYFTAWGIYGRNYQVTDIPALKVTDINYAFVNIGNGECVLGDPWADVDKHYPQVTTSLGTFPEDSWVNPQSLYFGNFNRLNTMKSLAAAKGHQINLFLSVGGWTWSKYFSDVAANSASRETFVNSCIAMMNRYQFDGIDLDWEYPVGGGLAGNHNRSEDKQNYTLLLKLFREKMGQNKLLTIAAPAGPSNIPNIEWNKIGQYVDWVNLMSYDFHGGWDNITGHNAGLYHNPTDSAPATLNADSAINRIVSLGFPINKLTMGVGFYGRGWERVPSINNGLFQSGIRSSLGTWESGVFDYHDLVNKYIPNYSKFVDTHAKVPYLYNSSTGVFISYENPQSMQIKANYILDKGMAGVMFWELSGDIRNSDSEQSLLGTLHTILKP